MTVKTIKNIIIDREDQKPILYDLFFNPEKDNSQVVIFSHGYKGFKDWGAWDLVAEKFANEGFIFIKFNFSHNGGTVEEPVDFPDLESFGNNTYSKELDDLGDVIDEVFKNELIKKTADTSGVCLIGHSRGGGIALLRAARDKRVSKLITWASVSDFKSRFPKGDELKKWEKDGVMYIENGRTKQRMPHYYSFYLDFAENRKKLDITQRSREINIPTLIVHGTADNSVDFSEAEKLHANISGSQLISVDNAMHTFGTSHPWREKDLSDDMTRVVDESVMFLKNVNI